MARMKLGKRFSSRKRARLAKRQSQPEKRYILEHRLPHVGDRPVSYTIPDSVIYLLQNAEKIAWEELEQLNLNEVNEGYLDQYITSICQMAISEELEEQRERHRRCCLAIREELTYDLSMCRAKWEDYTKKWNEIQEELEGLRK